MSDLKKLFIFSFLIVFLSCIGLGEGVTIRAKEMTFEDYAKLTQISNTLVELHIHEKMFEEEVSVRIWVDVYKNGKPKSLSQVDWDTVMEPDLTDPIFSSTVYPGQYTTIILFLEKTSQEVGNQVFEMTILSEGKGTIFAGPTKLKLDDINDPILSGGYAIRRCSPSFKIGEALPLYEIFAVEYGGIFRGGDYSPSINAQLYNFYAVVNVEFNPIEANTQ